LGIWNRLALAGSQPHTRDAFLDRRRAGDVHDKDLPFSYCINLDRRRVPDIRVRRGLPQ
jgi:hypothetical protein